MSKILFCTLGTGMYENKQTGEKEYIKTVYKDVKSGKTSAETSYIFEAFLDLYGYDKFVILGTCGSKWDQLYLTHFKDNADDCDFDYADKLEKLQRTGATADPETFRSHLDKLKETLGNKCLEIIVLKYGMDEAEMDYNFRSMAKVGEIISNGDTLSFDITHSFRSLAFYEFLTVTYFKDVLRKNVTLEKVSYGMNEGIKKGEPTPIINIQPIVGILDFIKAAEEYKRFGTARLLSELIETGKLNGIGTEEGKALKHLGDTGIISAGGKDGFKKLIRICKMVSRGDTPANISVKYIFEDLAKKFGDCIGDDISLSFKLAGWHCRYGRYMEAAMYAEEGALDFVSKLTSIQKRTPNNELQQKMRTASAKEDAQTYLDHYNKIRIIRNDLMHGDENPDTVKLGILIGNLSGLYENHFKKNNDNCAELKTAIKDAYASR
jgi:CRISPR-associated Csx2 family protein